MSERTQYRPFDQDVHLGPPPWSPDDPAVQAWEQYHDHDVRLKCYVEFGCQAIEYAWDAAEARADRLAAALDDVDSRISGVTRALRIHPSHGIPRPSDDSLREALDAARGVCHEALTGDPS